MLHLPLPASTWFEKALILHGLQEIPLSSAIAFRATELPLLHKDPADRMIIASSLEKNLCLLTPDTHIQEYPDIQWLW
ncbi:MAG: type II toxin-antitoxin system VapC family toxin [SAR324 cluster bacterium]|nr:type II toxin-antitoxin system VapC family toxin [SAR324 cluster bacterium]